MRLHITPLDANLLPTVLGPTLAKTAENISYHSIPTFPENDYGFIDLPETDAKNLISKLNGAILRGKKMKVEQARSKKRSHDVVEETVSLPDQSQKKAKKPKKDIQDDVLTGHLLSPDRKVKRGWTEPKSDGSARSKSKDKKQKKDSKHQAPSQYTEGEELLFRTKLPPNKEHLDTTTQRKSEKKTGRKPETIVHEFQRTEIQPDFVRDTASSGQAAEYVDHVGWVDRKGEVLEQAPSSNSKMKPNAAEGLRIGIPAPNGAKTSDKQPKSPQSTSSDDTSDSATTGNHPVPNVQEDVTSDSDISSSSSSGSDTDAGSNQDPEAEQETRSTPPGSGQPSLQTPQKVHPLEALFKRPKQPVGQEIAKPSLEIETSFSFFDQSAADADDELPPMPATPFTSHDLRSREIRSAAPTPDTAHPSRFTSFASALASRPGKGQLKDETTQEVLGNASDVPASDQSGERAQSDFEKRFWAERGQNNRAWKSRRKAALKEQRQKENRLRRPRNW